MRSQGTFPPRLLDPFWIKTARRLYTYWSTRKEGAWLQGLAAEVEKLKLQEGVVDEAWQSREVTVRKEIKGEVSVLLFKSSF